MGKRRVNLTLPEDLWNKLHARVPNRKLSQYIAEATATRLAEEERAELRERIKEQCLARAAQDMKIAEEFFAAEQRIADRIGS